MSNSYSETEVQFFTPLNGEPLTFGPLGTKLLKAALRGFDPEAGRIRGHFDNECELNNFTAASIVSSHFNLSDDPTMLVSGLHMAHANAEAIGRGADLKDMLCTAEGLLPNDDNEKFESIGFADLISIIRKEPGANIGAVGMETGYSGDTQGGEAAYQSPNFRTSVYTGGLENFAREIDEHLQAGDARGAALAIYERLNQDVLQGIYDETLEEKICTELAAIILDPPIPDSQKL